jgi:hypothetical protein
MAVDTPLDGTMQDEATTSHQTCLERVADGWRWRAIPSTGLTVMQAGVTAFLGLTGTLLFVLGVRIAVEPDQAMQGMLLLLDAIVLVVIVFALRSMIVRLVPWREAIFIVEGTSPQVLLLLRGERRKVIALADVAEIRVIYAGPADSEPTDTYLEVRRAGRWSGLLVGRRGYEPTAAAELRELLPADIEVCMRND